MTIAELRRKVNDSYIGQRINNSIPGILVEGLSRAIYDTGNQVKYGGMLLGADLVSRKRPLAGLALGGMTLVEAVADSIKEIDPETHYSHTSPLYEMTSDVNGKNVMERVPVRDALLLRIAQYSPKTALGLTLATAQPAKVYQ